MKTLKQLLAKTEEFQIEVQELLELREEYYEERSEKWQESEKGEIYSMETEFVSTLNDALNEAISDLQLN